MSTSMLLPPSRAAAQLHKRAGLEFVTFDVDNRTHIEAVISLVKDGRQHPTLRFHLEPPFHDVRSMISSKITHAYLDKFMEPVHND